MADKEQKLPQAGSVAPGYPAGDAVRKIDVTGYEPAAVFHPVEPEEVERGAK